MQLDLLENEPGKQGTKNENRNAAGKPGAGRDLAATSLSVRLSSLLYETDILWSLPRNALVIPVRVISVLCGVLAYLIGLGAIFLLASYINAKSVGFDPPGRREIIEPSEGELHPTGS
jgi:hypothetical protein